LNEASPVGALSASRLPETTDGQKRSSAECAD